MHRSPDRRLVTHDFPLRPDLTVSIQLPTDLTVADAERMTGFVTSLVFESDTETRLRDGEGKDGEPDGG